MLGVDRGFASSKSDAPLKPKAADRRAARERNRRRIFLRGGTPVPLDRPDLAVVGIFLSEDGPGHIVRKQLLPAAAPDVVVAGTERNAARSNARVLPQDLAIERFVHDAPDSPTQFGQDDNSQRAVLDRKSVVAGQGPAAVDRRFHESVSYLSCVALINRCRSGRSSPSPCGIHIRGRSEAGARGSRGAHRQW